MDLSLVHSGLLIFLLQLAKLPEKDIVEMIFFPLVNEACRVFSEGIAVKAADLDISSLMGMGFPPYRFVFYRVKGFLSIIQALASINLFYLDQGGYYVLG